MVVLVLRQSLRSPWNSPQSLGCLCLNTAAWPQLWRSPPGLALLLRGTSPSPVPLALKHPGSPGTALSPGTGPCPSGGRGGHLPFSSVLWFCIVNHEGENLLPGKAKSVYCVGYDLFKVLQTPIYTVLPVTSRAARLLSHRVAEWHVPELGCVRESSQTSPVIKFLDHFNINHETSGAM